VLELEVLLLVGWVPFCRVPRWRPRSYIQPWNLIKRADTLVLVGARRGLELSVAKQRRRGRVGVSQRLCY